jgi:hypothetical protein
MKNYIIAFALIFTSTLLFGQNSKGFAYQTVIRDQAGNLQSNSAASFRVSIYMGTASNLIYEELHDVSTDQNGYVNFIIGRGQASQGDFNSIPWQDTAFYVGVEADIDFNGFESFGIQELQAVPLALYAENCPVPIDGIDGNDGVGIDSIQMNQNGQLAIHLSDSTVYLSDDLRGVAGERGQDAITYNVGDTALGGIVFYVEPDGKHGLVASLEPINQPLYIDIRADPSNAHSASFSLATGNALYAGETNTHLLHQNILFASIQENISYLSIGNINHTVEFFQNQSIAGYSDWYIPSQFELSLFMDNLPVEAENVYSDIVFIWTSTEINSDRMVILVPNEATNSDMRILSAFKGGDPGFNNAGARVWPVRRF